MRSAMPSDWLRIRLTAVVSTPSLWLMRPRTTTDEGNIGRAGHLMWTRCNRAVAVEPSAWSAWTMHTVNYLSGVLTKYLICI